MSLQLFGCYLVGAGVVSLEQLIGCRCRYLVVILEVQLVG